jgi:hypothetical protein
MSRTEGLRVESEATKLWSPGTSKAAVLVVPGTDEMLPDNKRDEYDWTKDEDDNIEC